MLARFLADRVQTFNILLVAKMIFLKIIIDLLTITGGSRSHHRQNIVLYLMLLQQADGRDHPLVRAFSSRIQPVAVVDLFSDLCFQIVEGRQIGRADV